MVEIFPEPPELCMQQPEDNEDINSEVVHRSYFSPDEIDNFDNNNCPPNTTPFGYKCVPLCKESHQQLQKTEAATFESAKHNAVSKGNKMTPCKNESVDPVVALRI
ncbi:hypothetical protein NQ317_002479 [Molorchus minor]|uniref:Uncharacterized protein n=1 Tax=Molorchus minor TaxID=1323400 RepID=A0ABQ9IV47_9CUCU|nr:hypothetical protein NQ317_002479 [Molorchus minor]